MYDPIYEGADLEELLEQNLFHRRTNPGYEIVDVQPRRSLWAVLVLTWTRFWG